MWSDAEAADEGAFVASEEKWAVARHTVGTFADIDVSHPRGTAMRTTTTILTDEMLAHFDERAPVYDRENRFFHEDWDELRAAGYLTACIPEDMGGGGWLLDEYVDNVQRLAYVAPATALVANMHSYWMGVAAELRRWGDPSLEWMLRRGLDGEVFCALHGEAGNEMPLLLATTHAERAEGGWRISGHKIFGSLTPVWTLGGGHAMDVSDPENPQIVHFFIPRDTDGIAIIDTWATSERPAGRST